MRIATFNIHTWTGDNEDYGVVNDEVFGDCAAFVRSLHLDALAIQEAPAIGREMRGLLDEFGEAIGMHCSPVRAYDIYNAIYTREKPQEVVRRDLDRHRGVVAAIVPSAFGEVALCATHLDHRWEELRLDQLEVLASFVEDLDVGALVMGDFNALDLRDYDAVTLGNIAEGRRAGRWEMPLGSVIEQIHDLGWLDLVRKGARPRAGAWEKRKALPQELTATSRFDTRVDYLFATPPLAAKVTVKAVEVRHARDVSDHGLVLAEISPAA